MKNEIKKRKEVVSPKCLKPKKDHEIRAPKPMKEKKEKKRDPDQKIEEEPT